jgi:hypothetical protein
MAEFQKIAGDAIECEFFQGRPPSSSVVVTTYQKLDHKLHPKAAKLLKSIRWGRVVLDEMQEIRSSTTFIAKNCEGLLSERRWMLSGTPLFEGIHDLRGELCFLRLEPFCGTLEDGFFEFAIQNPWEASSRYGLDTLGVLRLFLLRRSKSMTIAESGLPLLGLKPLTVTFEPVPQDSSERALYCFLEHLVHSTIRHAGAGDETKNKLFLRLLRELCASPTLVSGGGGSASQLATLNRLMSDHNGRLHLDEAPTTDRPYSCDEAIILLSHIVDKARVEDGFETSLQMGGGGGVSRRDRAVESVEEQYSAAQDRLRRAEQAIETAYSKRAKANWHKLLELVTTGNLPGVARNSIQRLWKWRYLVTHHSAPGLPVLLTRGWRPSARFFETPSAARAKRNWSRLLKRVTEGGAFYDRSSNRKENDKENALDSVVIEDTDKHTTAAAAAPEELSSRTRRIHALWRWRSLLPEKYKEIFACRPVKKIDRFLSLRCFSCKNPQFVWAHPFSLLLSDLPRDVTKDNLHNSIVKLLVANSAVQRVQVHDILWQGHAADGSWKAVVQFANEKDYSLFYNKVKSTEGVPLCSSKPLPWIEKDIAEAMAKLEEAKAESRVYPCDLNRKKESKAKNAYKLAEKGLRIHEKFGHAHGHVLSSRTLDQIRSALPKHSSSHIASANSQILKSIENISIKHLVKEREQRVLNRLQAVMSSTGVSEEVQGWSAFETLQALKAGESEKTRCQVCLGPLGEGEKSDGKVSLTRCGHLFCVGCWEVYMDNKAAQGLDRPPCIACRKVTHRDQIILVDPARTADQEAFDLKRTQARALVQQASAMLDESRGQLAPHLWEALYLAIDLPPDVDRSAHGSFTAIPCNVLAHFRQATGNSLSDGSDRSHGSWKLSSKIRALLADLPSDEKSVVFASSKLVVKHLLTVFGLHDIGCRGLFTGQSEEESEHVVRDWQLNDQTPVLVVQAGAAACGLTLTAASKMFLLEPFIQYEEERQAYGRLHRYGQQKEVECKIYYTPVSVESRLLEWRKRGGATNAEGSVVYAPLRSEAMAGEDVPNKDGQTRFLLGLGEDCPAEARP